MGVMEFLKELLFGERERKGTENYLHPPPGSLRLTACTSLNCFMPPVPMGPSCSGPNTPMTKHQSASRIVLPLGAPAALTGDHCLCWAGHTQCLFPPACEMLCEQSINGQVSLRNMETLTLSWRLTMLT